MVKINRIYTRTGDRGETGLVGGTRVRKDSARVHTYGEVDELNSYLGWARTMESTRRRSKLAPMLERIQNSLFDLGAELATAAESSRQLPARVGEAEIDELEGWIDALHGNLPELRSFVLPGGSELNSVLHVARAVCRRAERAAVALSRAETVRAEVIIYLNRLSDLLFAMARFEIARSKKAEFLWVPGDRRPMKVTLSKPRKRKR